MSLLRLAGIGKIYYSEGSVAVGIRGVDMTFERGEFVAITGASGSGKSTLLNVISGMDSYEEGELYIEGKPTSHYLEADWEDYRSKYISFIFQDYNILESYTVLQNVELSLMHIRDRRERRARAVELLRRVGMEKHLRQKGSKLSGGQKQRTVIARALAKDSPIILADEPTGNLDEATSKEIIELLREVAKDKLLIMVTHNYEEVAHCATRHIRIFDGAVEFDRGEKPIASDLETKRSYEHIPIKKRRFEPRRFMRELRDGIGLGWHVFASRPKLAIFTCMLMIIGMLGVFLMTSICFDRDTLDYLSYDMFEYKSGRLVVVRRDGEAPTIDEIRELAESYGASGYLACDYLLDKKISVGMDLIPRGFIGYNGNRSRTGTLLRPISEHKGSLEGSLPSKDGEIMLRLPISEKEYYDFAVLGQTRIYCQGISFTLTGISYYYDNNLTPEAYITDSDYEAMSVILAFLGSANSIAVNVTNDTGAQSFTLSTYDLLVSRELGDRIYFSENYGYNVSGDVSVDIVEIPDSELALSADKLDSRLPEELKDFDGYYACIIGEGLARELASIYTEHDYSQFSLLFKDDKEASRAARSLLDSGYIAVLSSSKYEAEPMESFVYGFLVLLMVAIWLGVILTLAFFIRLCQARSIVSFKNDIAIMRSMGIGATVIKISMYMRSVIALIPAAAALFIVAALIFTSPKLNGLFTFLYAPHYALICLGMLLIAFRVSYKQQSKLFAGSVKKTLTGGELND